MAQASAEELYEQVVKPLPPSERLKLARIILNEIPPQAIVDYSDSWSDEDIRDFTTASWRHIEAQVDGDAPDAQAG